MKLIYYFLIPILGISIKEKLSVEKFVNQFSLQK